MRKARIFFATASFLVTFAAVLAAKRAVVSGRIYTYDLSTGTYTFEGEFLNLPCSTGAPGCVNAAGKQRYLYISFGNYSILRKD